VPKTEFANNDLTTIDMADQNPTTKKFGKGERSIPHPSQKASKYYPAEDVSAPKQVSVAGEDTRWRGAHMGTTAKERTSALFAGTRRAGEYPAAVEK
jgi:large subunit ribosomal protein L6e